MIINSNLKVATGFYTIWDIIAKLDRKTYEWLQKQERKKPETEFLNTKDAAAYTFNQALETGGSEYLITNELHKQLKNIFSFKERRLGGNGYNMGKALYDLDVIPLVSYPTRPKSIMTESPNFKVAVKDGFTIPRKAIRKDDPEYEHLIIEFQEDQEREINVSGRHIFSHDQMSFDGIFDNDFFFYGFNREYIDVLIIAYAHLLLPKYKNKTDIVVDCLLNQRRPEVHLEIGDGFDESIIYMIKKFSDAQCVDSLGCNEKECKKYLGAKSEEIDELRTAALEAAKNYGLKRICVHAPEFVFSITRYNVEKERAALHKGVLVATALTIGNISQNLSKVAKLPRRKIDSRIESGGEGIIFVLFQLM